MDRRTYVVHGVGLMVLKYAVDSALVWVFAGRVWTPTDYFQPLFTARIELLQDSPPWLAPALLLFTLPFLWIGVSMSLRRALDADKPAWLSLLFFIPVANYVLMVVLSLLPTADRFGPAEVSERARSALLGAAAAVGITLATVLVGVSLRRVYSAGLFLGTPFAIGYICSYIYNQTARRTAWQSVVAALGGVVVASLALMVFALEGVVCLVMAMPLAMIVAIPGALLGRAVSQRVHGTAGATLAVIAAPLLVGFEPKAAPPVHEVVTVVEIAAPPDVVWRNVVTFPELPPPTEWLFRAGVAAPIAARIEGTGVGAVRYCDFTTGSFVEPVVAWEEGRLLAFDITDQAPPMTELSPYREVDAPHLKGYFRATHGEFRLEPLPNGGTRLEGRTRYVVEMFPQTYWQPFAGTIVEAIHGRVLRHIGRLSEQPR